MALRAAGFVIIQATTPAEDPVTVGYLWADTANSLLKQCTSVSPYVWTAIGPFSGSPSPNLTLTGGATPATPAAGTGTLYATTSQGHTQPSWIDEDGTILRLSRDNVLLVRNTSGADITKGQALDLYSSTGNVPAVRLAEADIINRHCEGVALEAIANNGYGLMMLAGMVSGLDTSSFAEGNSLYLSVTPGVLTATAPSTPNFVQRIAVVTRAHATQGSIELVVDGPSTAFPDPTLFGTVSVVGAPGVFPSGTLVITDSFAGDGAARAGLKLRRYSQANSGTPTAGDGAEYLIQLQDTNGNYGNIAGVGGRARTVAPTTLIGRLELNAKATGAYNAVFDDVIVAIDGSGVVGIGSHWATISNVPSEMLHLYDGSQLIETSGSGGIGGYKLKTPTHAWNMGVQADDDWTLFDVTNGADRLTVDKTTGNIKVGVWNGTAIDKQFGGTGVDNSTYTYTPTVTGVTNIDSVTAAVCQYVRIGNIVIVSGSVAADPTSAGVDTEFGMSLPIASNFASSGQLGGTATVRDVAGEVVAIAADATNDRADFRWITGSTANRTYRFMFMYQVI